MLHDTNKWYGFTWDQHDVLSVPRHLRWRVFFSVEGLEESACRSMTLDREEVGCTRRQFLGRERGPSESEVLHISSESLCSLLCLLDERMVNVGVDELPTE